MSIQSIPFTDKQSWLKERVKDITSTEVSALFGLSPYSTEFELFHQKKDGVIVLIDENERMAWGNRLEESIALEAAERNGWTVRPFKEYIRNTEHKIGSSFDFQITSLEQPAILEVKNVDSIQFARNWIERDDGEVEAPEHIEIQVQHQMLVSGIDTAFICALVGGNRLVVVKRVADKEIHQAIIAKVKEFWGRVEANNAPGVDYEKDAQYLIKTLYASADENSVMDATDNDLINDLISQYNNAKKEEKNQANKATAIKAQILEAVGTHSKVLTSLGTISCSMTKPSQGTLVTPEMLGTYIGQRAGFRNFRFTEAKK